MTQHNSSFHQYLEKTLFPVSHYLLRLSDHSATLIDHILVKHNKYTLNEEIVSGNLYCDITNHLPNFIGFGEGKINKPDRPLVRIYGNKNIKKFQEKLKLINWDILEAGHVNEAYDLFWEMVWYAYCESFPLKRLSTSNAKNKIWLTAGLLNCIKNIHLLFSKYLNRPTHERKESTENTETYLIE